MSWFIYLFLQRKLNGKKEENVPSILCKKKKKINIHTWVWVVCTLIRTAMCLGSLSTEDKLEFSLEFGWEALS